jgi:hypothetical protein
MGGRGAIHTYEQRAKDDQHMPKEARMEYQQSPPTTQLLPLAQSSMIDVTPVSDAVVQIEGR